MKKLALASVAFAGVTAFGGGDSFASGFTGFTTGPSGFSYTDTTVWGPVGQMASTGAGNTASLQAHSINHNIGVTASFGSSTISYSPTLTVFNQNCANSPPSNSVCAGFKPNTHVLGANGTGTISLAFTQKLSSIGFQLSPQAVDWGAELTAYTGNATAGYTKIGNTQFTGKEICRGTGYNGCTNPAFLGISSTTPITAATVSLSGSQPGPLLIGTLDEKLFSNTPPIPEPATLSLVGAGLLGLGAMRRRRRSSDPANGSRWSPFGRWRVVSSPPDAKHLVT